MPARIILALLVAGGILFRSTDAFSQARPLLTQYERQPHPAARPNPRCAPEPYEITIRYSKVTVFESGAVEVQTSTLVPCLGEVGDPPFARRWEAPGDRATVYRSRLRTAEFEQLKAFLDRPDVQAIQSFLNAGPGVGDFKIAIARPTGIQNIDVLSLSPNHYQLLEDPSLIHLVCKAKELVRRSSRAGALPEWCRNVRPLNPLGERRH